MFSIIKKAPKYAVALLAWNVPSALRGTLGRALWWCGVAGSTSVCALADQLEEDVDALNAAVESYLGAGGEIGPADDAQLVLVRLESAGLEVGRGMAVRLVPVLVSEAPLGRKWAYWDAPNRQFQLWRGAAPDSTMRPIVAFKRTFSGSPVTSEDTAGAAADRAAPRRAQSRARLRVPIATAAARAWGGGSTPVVSSGLPRLASPSFDPPSGSYAAPFFAREGVRLVTEKPLPEGGELLYMVGISGWKRYDGAPIRVAPGEEVIAVACAEGIDAYRNSMPATATYRMDRVALEIRLSAPLAELRSGDLRPGNDAQFPLAAVSNIGALPAGLRSAGVVEIRFTVDGSDPLTSETALRVPLDPATLSGRVPLEVAPFLGIGGDTLRLRAAAKSLREELGDSQVREVTLRVRG